MDYDKKTQSKQDVSLDDIRDMLWEAVHGLGQDVYLTQVYPAYLIYEDAGKYYKVGWSFMDGEVQLGTEKTEVERTWVDLRNSQDEADEGFETMMRLDKARDTEGTAWDVTICQPGFTKNGWYLPEDALRAGASMFEGVDVNLYELPDATHVPNVLFDIKSLLARNKAGWIDNVRYVAGQGLQGVLHFLDSAKWLGRNLMESLKEGAAAYGLSYDAPVRAKKDTVDGRSVFRLIRFLGADSVDIVTRPAAGGKFNRAVASRQAPQGREIMDREELLALISEKRPDLLDGKDLTSISDEDVTALARMAMVPKADDGGQTTDDPASPEGAVEGGEVALLRCEMALDRALNGSDLPEHAIKRLRSEFKDRVFTDEDLTRAIADMKDFLAAVDTGTGDADPVPGSVIGVGIGTIERAQMAVDRMFDLTQEDMQFAVGHERLDHKPFFEDLELRSKQDFDEYDQVPAFSSIREMYTFFTGDPEVTGRFNRKRLPADLRASMDITSGTFSYVLGNTLGRRLVQAYRRMDYKENLLVSVKKPVTDFRQQEAVLVGGFPDIETVDPESGDFQEISTATDEESTYTIGQKGNLLTITRKTIINDDMSLIKRLIDGFGRAFARTHGKYAWAFLIDNANCSDATAWFTSGHGNLGAAALTHATALVAYLALAKTTEKDSSERIGLLDMPDIKLNLIHPPDLISLAGMVESEDFYYSTNDLTDKVPNPLKGKIKAHMLSLLTDTADWALLMPPNIIDMVEMGYLNGREEPEFFVADSPQAEQVFVADKIRHKGRHEYAGAVIDWRSGYKAEV